MKCIGLILCPCCFNASY